MGSRKIPFSVDEHFHCYTRGIDKRITFQDEQDYERFIETLYVCNDISRFNRDDHLSASHVEILQPERLKPLVEVLAYCLMPNHFHLVLKEITEGGISLYMQRVGTMYTMYFNTRNNRVGGLFVGPFRAKHIDTDIYLKHVIQYTHLNPLEFYMPDWKQGVGTYSPLLEKKLMQYTYSSLPEYNGIKRVQKNVLTMKAVESLYDSLPSLSESISAAAEYYKNLAF